jgi:hypothetical protein
MRHVPLPKVRPSKSPPCSGTCTMIQPDPAGRKHGHARMAVVVASARRLPTWLVTLWPGPLAEAGVASA